MLFQVINGPTVSHAKKEIKEGSAYAEGYEFRIDSFKETEALENLIQEIDLPVLITIRKESQGGSFLLDEMERRKLLEKYLDLEPEYVDIEADTPFVEELANRYLSTQFILSHHDFEVTPNNLEELYSSLKIFSRAIVKIACFANASLDALRMMKFVKEKSDQGQKVIGISMGEKGQFARSLGQVVGNVIDYAPLTKEKESDPGQYTLQELCETFRYKTLNRQSKIYALLGHPIAQSTSDQRHSRVFSQLDLNALYVKMDLLPDEIESFFSLIETLPFDGFSITMPLKETVQPFIHVDPKAKKIGAVNTLQRTEKGWAGYNTDCIGALDAIEKKRSVKEKKVILLGARGSAKAIVYEALLRGAKVMILNRSVDKAERLAADLGCEGYHLSKMEDLFEEGYDVLINSTSVGMGSDESPIPSEFIHPKALIMEVISHPAHTKLVKEAMQKGCETVLGIEMWVYQAIEQYLYWFKQLKASQIENAIRINL